MTSTPEFQLQQQQQFQVAQGDKRTLLLATVKDPSGSPVDISAYTNLIVDLVQRGAAIGDGLDFSGDAYFTQSDCTLGSDGTVTLHVTRAKSAAIPSGSFGVTVAISLDGTDYQQIARGVLSVLANKQA